MNVFYSWQSDLSNATNRGLIQAALESASDQIKKDNSVDIEPAVDRDTLGLPGSPSIDEAIFLKIASADAYVADISIINRDHLALAGQHLDEAGKRKLRPTPNPNVLLELGFAVRALGWDRIILVFNLATGDPKTDLPFDLRQKRRVEYTSTVSDADRATPRKHLTDIFDDAIRTIANHQALRPAEKPPPTPTQLAIEAVENQTSARKARVRAFADWMISELKLIQPELKLAPPSEEQAKILEEAIGKTASLSKLWSEVCEAIALAGDPDSADSITKIFETILQEYDHKPGFAGSFHESWFDYWRFIGHEFYTVWIGSLLKEGKWNLIDEALSTSFHWQMHQDRTNNGTVYFDEMSDYIRLFDLVSKNRRRLSFHADILASRYRDAPIGSKLSFEEFISADLFLFLAGDFRINDKWRGWLQWRPWSVLYMKHEPRFLINARSAKVATGLLLALGAEDIPALREMLSERVPRLSALWENGFWRSPISKAVIDDIGSKA